MNRNLACVILLGLGLTLGVPGGLAAKKEKKEKSEVAVKVDSTFFDHQLNSVGVLPLLTPSVVDERVEMVQDLVEGHMQEAGNYTLLFPEDLKSAAGNSTAKEAYDTLLRTWQQRRLIDPPSMEIVASTLGIDAIMGIEVTHWEQYKLDVETEGYSTTTVGLKVYAYARDRTLLWEASRVYVANSPPYNPANSVVADAAGQARPAGRSGPPDPPEFDDVATRVINEIAATWPPNAARAKEDKGKGKKK